jgi:hypothetical protein
MGDTTICTGKVVAKSVEGLHHVVELELASTNQRGENTAPGTATLILPSRESGPAVLPTPEPETMRRGAAMMHEAADRARN